MATRSGAEARRDERVREPGSRGTLDVEPDGQPARLGQPADELLGHVRRQRARRVVDDDPRRAELGQVARLLDERLDAAVAPRAVDEARVERATGSDDRLTGLAQVRDVVQRVVQAEDVDAVRGRRRDEAPHDIGADGLRADEEPAAQRDPERRRRARVERADALPRALDATPHRRVEAAAARDLEAREPARSRIDAIRSTSPVGTLPASGSCESSRIVVSTSCGIQPGTLASEVALQG